MAALRVFVSYASATNGPEGQLAPQLINDLRQAGVEVVADETAVPEAQFLELLQRELPKCHWFLFIQTAESQRSLRTQVAMNNALQQVQHYALHGVLRIVCPSATVEHAPVSWSETLAYVFDGDYPRVRDRVFLELNVLQIEDTMRRSGSKIHTDEPPLPFPSAEKIAIPYPTHNNISMPLDSPRQNNRMVVNDDRPLHQDRFPFVAATLAPFWRRKHVSLRSPFILSSLIVLLVLIVASATVFIFLDSTPVKSDTTTHLAITKTKIPTTPTPTQVPPMPTSTPTQVPPTPTQVPPTPTQVPPTPTPTLPSTGPNNVNSGPISSAANGLYISAELGYTSGNQGMLRARASQVGPWERFYLKGPDSCNSIFEFRSAANGLYVSAELGYTGSNYGMLRARASQVGPWERFYLICLSNGKFAFRSAANGLYVSAELGYTSGNHGMLRARASQIGPWEQFSIGSL